MIDMGPGNSHILYFSTDRCIIESNLLFIWINFSGGGYRVKRLLSLVKYLVWGLKLYGKWLLVFMTEGRWRLWNAITSWQPGSGWPPFVQFAACYLLSASIPRVASCSPVPQQPHAMHLLCTITRPFPTT